MFSALKPVIDIFCEAVKFLINKYFLTKVIEKEDIFLSVKKNIEFFTDRPRYFGLVL